MLIECYECKAQISDTAAACPHCGALPPGSDKAVTVSVADFDVKFVTLFIFLIKLALAAFPALMLGYTVITVLSGIITPLLH